MITDQHYSQNLSISKIKTSLEKHYPTGADSYQLAPLDQLHIGGIKASEKIVDRIKHLKPHRILDIGSGAGGLNRLTKQAVTSDYFCLDITHKLNRLNEILNSTHSKVTGDATITGDAQSLPFEDNSFDLVIMQHTLMNVPNKAQSLSECKRILKPNGSILLHEVLSGSKPEKMTYPVPWARSAESSPLPTIESLTDLFESVGASHLEYQDWSEEALVWRQRQSQKERKGCRD